MKPVAHTALLILLLAVCTLYAQTAQAGPGSGGPPAQAAPLGLGGPPQGPPPGETGRPPGDERFFHGLSLMALDEKASVLAEQGKTDAAIRELRKVYAYQLPKDHPVYEVRVRLIGKLAKLLAASGNKEEATKTIEEMLVDVAKDTPAEAAAWFEAGRAYRELGMSDEALKAFDRAIAVSDQLATREFAKADGPEGRGHGPRPGRPGERPPGQAPGPPPPDR